MITHLNFPRLTQAITFWRAPLLVGSALCLLFNPLAFGASFTAGNLTVLRMGDGVQTLANTGNSLFIDEFTTNGVLVQSIAIPDSGATALIESGAAGSEGALMASPDGQLLCLAGYNVTRPFASSVVAATALAAPRAVATVNVYGAYVLAAVTTNQFSTQNIRSGATDGANNFWAAGSGSGTFYFGFGAGTNTIQTTTANGRVVSVVNGHLYFSTGSGTRGIYGFVGGGFPTTATATTNFINTGGTSSPYGFAFNAANTVAYIADDAAPASNGGVQKWTNSGTAWTLAYIVTATPSRAVAVDWSGSNPVLYATTTTNSLITVTDTGAASPATLLVSGTNNTALRGLTFSPLGGVSAPLITGQPQSLTNVAGTTANFSVTATGASLGYQWYFTNAPISGATSSNHSIASVSSGDAGNYFVIVSNAGGSATSAVATLTVLNPPVIAQPPASLAVCERFPAAFAVGVVGDAPIFFQWRFNGATISGANSSNYVIANASAASAGNYDVIVSNASGSVTSTVATLTIQATFAGFVNKGLVGVGRIDANSFDLLGAGVDTLGGIFSAIHVDGSSLVRTGDETNGYTYSGALYALPDRGFGDGAQDYHPRVQTMSFSITPYYGTTPTNQTQVVFTTTNTTLFTYGGTNFTGYDPDDLSVTNFPQSTPGSLGLGKRSFDAEGIVRTADGGYFVSDEYGPMIARFDASGALQYTMLPPEGLIPRRGTYPNTTNAFTGTNNPNSGRRSNRGFEGLALMPDGKRLATVLQSPAMQDGGANNPSRNTRLLMFDIDAASPTFGRAITEYVYQLTLNGAVATNRHTPLSELLALNNEQFLVLERDGIGLGGTVAKPIYKRVNVLSTRGATNIINTGYDLEVGAPGQLSLPQSAALPSNVGALQRFDLVDIIDTNQLAKFGLNINTNQDNNTICEKWEGLGLIPLNDPAFPNDFLLLVGNDNDFKATNVIHNGVLVGTNAVTVDNMLLAYRVTLPTGCGTTNTPANLPPSIVITSPTNATFSAPATVVLTAAPYDQDGVITNVDFYLAGGYIGSDTSFPFQHTLSGVAAGSYDFTAVAFDQSGASATSAVKTVIITVTNVAPSVAMSIPTNGALVRANANLPLVAAAGDADGSITNVEFYEGGTLLGSDASAPFSVSAPSIAPGAHSYFAIAYDNQGAGSTSAVVNVTALIAPSIAMQPQGVTVCERFPATFGVGVNGDAPLSFQWRFNGTNIAGATGSNYTIASAATNHAGNYTVVVGNPVGSVTSAVATLTIQATFAGFVNKGLVGVGRIDANSFDLLGAGVDTLGGIFSAMHLDQTTVVRTGDETNGYTYAATLYALPDRGFGDGAQDYHPRVQTMSLSFTPYYGTAPTSQTQIVIAPVATTLFTYGGTNFTGYDPDDLSVTNFPQSTPGSLGLGKRSFDAEGIVRTADGGYFVSDEYGPMIARFDASGALQYSLFPPEGLLPRRGTYPNTTNAFTGTNNPNSGRRSNRGFEGLTLMPDGKRLATVLQSPAIQDGGANNPSRNTRLLIFDIDAASATFGRAITEYVYQLTLNGAVATNRHTPLSELLALNNEQFLVLERDGIGLGATPAKPIYKRVNVLSTRGATNIINTGYDLEVGAPGQLALPQSATLPSNVGALQRFDLVDIIDTNQLAKFGLNINTNQDNNTICEKWEGLALIPLNDTNFPNDFLLLVGNDNDFKATNVIHNGVLVGTNAVTVDNMLLAYRVTLPTGCGTTNTPVNLPPFIVITSPTNATLSSPATIALVATPYDQDGIVTNVQFFEGVTLLGQDSTFPFSLTLPPRADGTYFFTAVAYDHHGASATSAVKTVIVTVTNISPTVAITSPANGANVRANANLALVAATADADGSVASVEFYEGGTLLGSDASAPFSVSAPSIAPGAHSYFAVAYDNQGVATTSAVVSVTAIIAPAITQQPQSRTNFISTEATFSVTATGDMPLAYQWRFNNAPISAATSPSLSVTNVHAPQAGNYTVVITNSGGSITSAVAVLTVILPVPASLTEASRSPGGVFQMTLTGSDGARYEIQSNTNLNQTNWITIGFVTNAGGATVFSDLLATNVPQNFYRALAR